MEGIDTEILDQLKQIENGRMTVFEFEDWHVGRTWGMTSRLIAEIDHTLAEKSLLTEEQLINDLLSHAQEAVLKLAPTG
ncbi:hypothetical protein [Candidatus Poriferisocius sp.]|uniref:hypothetical protein n=1 Tax=Candidatus Poriferisocius sp. TaxID=3101276 RepID=UPI003B012631